MPAMMNIGMFGARRILTFDPRAAQSANGALHVEK
jgi:hypothetical protein